MCVKFWNHGLLTREEKMENRRGQSRKRKDMIEDLIGKERNRDLKRRAKDTPDEEFGYRGHAI